MRNQSAFVKRKLHNKIYTTKDAIRRLYVTSGEVAAVEQAPSALSKRAHPTLTSNPGSARNKNSKRKSGEAIRHQTCLPGCHSVSAKKPQPT
ncbi:hypothetical protein NDU88_001668 [Pleurodeles waltl]|uniref:Uncharacterized protein n=1 Tax=Pleurodeles waltl TaxID=8319 RepID=A0AAV7S899_PLEWA|nr:hypothetical protein NDU88_001668 [Pleurodeles waltl]